MPPAAKKNKAKSQAESQADELRDARYRLAAIVESSDDAIVSKDLNGIIKTWNASATRIFGYQPEEIIGKSVLTLIPPELHWEETQIMSKLAAGERIDHYETQRVRKDGQRLHVSLTISPIKDHHGQVIGASKTARDIGDKKRSEAALIQSEKLAAIGRMAAAIAHEVNNPLEAVTNLGYLLFHHPSLDEEARAWARMLLDEVGRASHITRQTLGFYRDTTEAIEVDLGEVMTSVLELHHHAIMRREVRLSVDSQEGMKVFGFPGELRQVFSNLVLNALDAMPSGGELRVRIQRVVEGAAGRAPSVRVSVADTGCGIPANIRAHIFEPFITTKEQGNGLGLWVSQGIAHKHGGQIKVWSCPERNRAGTVFAVLLPVDGAPQSRRADAA